MKTTKEKSILIIAPSLIAESISLKLTSLDNDLSILLDRNDPKANPDLMIWNILNYESEDLILFLHNSNLAKVYLLPL